MLKILRIININLSKIRERNIKYLDYCFLIPSSYYLFILRIKYAKATTLELNIIIVLLSVSANKIIVKIIIS